MDEALRQLLAKHRSGTPPFPTSFDLYRELQAVTQDSYQYLLHDLFEKNTFWELATERATAKKIAAGIWQVTLNLRARKVVIDQAGVEIESPMDDWIELGIFGDGKPYVEKHRIRSGAQTITVTVPFKPARAGIDPDNLLIERDTDDNVRDVTVER